MLSNMIPTNSKFSTVPPRVVKLKEAARYLGISPVSVRRLIKRGFIKPIRVLRHVLISIVELDRFVNSGGLQ
jgi:excisionase family DNA binding protein